MFSDLTEYFLGVSFITGLLGYLGKKVVETFLAARLKSHEQALQANLERHKSEFQLEIEREKARLQQLSNEHSVRFQDLHVRRAEIIEKIYADIFNLDLALRSLLREFQLVNEADPAQKIATIGKLHDELMRYFGPRGIFLSERSAEILDEMLTVTKDVFLDVSTYTADPNHPEYAQTMLERREQWESARQKYRQSFTKLKVELGAQFRRLIGS
jgi:hypothetical protein